jgi:hypothetical protein
MGIVSLFVRGKLQGWEVFSISHAVGYRFDAFRDELDVELLRDADDGGRFIVRSSVTSCRSSADAMAIVSHFPSMYVLASS